MIAKIGRFTGGRNPPRGHQAALRADKPRNTHNTTHDALGAMKKVPHV